MDAMADRSRTVDGKPQSLLDLGYNNCGLDDNWQQCSTTKGGLRFHPTVTQSVIKFLGFEQIFKNSLTGLPIGGGKGGSDFDPKGKSDAEILRFCQSFATSICQYIGPNIDVPAGDIGVGGREIGYMYGQYKRTATNLSKHGFGMLWGGSVPHPEVHGYGPVSFAKSFLEARGDSLRGKRCLVTGSGKVALAVADKLVADGAIPLTLSDTSGFIYEEGGLPSAKLAQISTIKAERGARIGRYLSLIHI